MRKDDDNPSRPPNPWRNAASRRHAMRETQPAAPQPAVEHPNPELRLYGLNAVRAVFARRPRAIRKVYLLEARIPQLQPLLKWCVRSEERRVGKKCRCRWSREHEK